MSPDAKFHKFYTQSWTKATFALLQGPKNAQIIIDILIYNHVSHCLSTRDIFSSDKPIKPPSHQTISRIILTDHNFTTHISSFPLTTTTSCLPKINIVIMTTALSMKDIPSHVALPNHKIPTATLVNSLAMRTPTPNSSNGRLLAIITSTRPLYILCNVTIYHPNASLPSEFEIYSWLCLIAISLSFSRYYT